MRISIRIALLAAMLFGTATLSAQGIEAFRAGLSVPDSLSHASVRVSEHGSAAEVIHNYDAVEHPAYVEGYRVRIFFDNSQTAGDDSASVQAAFREQFPSIPTYRAYESPSWIVTVGNCATIEEALILQNRVKHSFKTAFIWYGRKIPITEFLKEGDDIPSETRTAEI